MVSLLVLSMIIIVIPFFLIFANISMSSKKYKDREKSTSFECGFDPFFCSRIPFSINFFLLSIMFLTFDIEIALMIPIIPSMMFHSINWLISSLMFMFILVLGLLIEWGENSISWSK